VRPVVAFFGGSGGAMFTRAVVAFFGSAGGAAVARPARGDPGGGSGSDGARAGAGRLERLPCARATGGGGGTGSDARGVLRRCGSSFASSSSSAGSSCVGSAFRRFDTSTRIGNLAATQNVSPARA